MRIQDLRPGDRVPAGWAAVEATLISWSAQHPVYPGLALVVWRLSSGELSFDALDVEQHLPDSAVPLEQSEDERLESLRRAIDWPVPPAGASAPGEDRPASRAGTEPGGGPAPSGPPPAAEGRSGTSR